MFHCNYRMIKDHPRSGKPHNLFNLFSHRWLIAVYCAISTGWLLITISAGFEPFCCILENVSALFTQVFRAVFTFTIQREHQLNCFYFAVYFSQNALYSPTP